MEKAPADWKMQLHVIGVVMMTKAEALVYVRYCDHVLYHRGDPAVMKPQVRECVGWLVHDCADYIILSWDRDAGPPSLRVGDPKASGLVVLRSDILEMKRIRESNSEIKPLFSKTEQPNMRENT